MSIFFEKKTSRYSVVRLDKFCIIIAKTTFLLADSQIPAHISPPSAFQDPEKIHSLGVQRFRLFESGGKISGYLLIVLPILGS